MSDALSAAENYLGRAGMLSLPGAVLYSGIEALKPGPLYLLGLNPGGSEGANLKDSLERSRVGINAYLDEVWAPGGRPQPKGQAVLQRRVQDLCNRLGLDTRQVPASNLAFTRSARVGLHDDFAAAAKACLPVHEIFAATIRPDFLLTFGSIENFKKVVSLRQIESRLAQHGDWKAHRGIATFAGRAISFGNIPHMSLWASDRRPEVVDWATNGFKREP